jgi:hypothetical protein
LSAVLLVAAATLVLSMRGAGNSAAISDARIDDAIERGLTYLRRDRSDLSALIVLDYLQRRYGLGADLAYARTEERPNDANRLRTWGRFVGDDRRAEPAALRPFTGASTIEDMITHTLYCDRAALPSSFVPILRAFAARGDYALTHAPLALKLARDNGCPVDDVAALALEKSLREQLRGLLLRRARDRRFEALDVRYEALAVLEDLLAERAPPQGAVTSVLAEQQPDGGWMPAADQRSAAHPTVLAVWALLAWRHPDAPVVHFARE